MKIETIQRISLRYYLIKIDNRYYLIDYVNPKKLQSYFLPFSQEMTWKIYDVTAEREQYGKENISFLTKIRQGILLFFLLLIVQMMTFPKNINLWYLTQNSFIEKNWFIVILGVIISALAIGMIFYIIPNSVDGLSSKKSYQLTVVSGRKEFSFFVRLIITFTFSVIFLFFGIFSSSFIGVILFSFLSNISLWFNNFFNIPFITKSDKYKIM